MSPSARYDTREAAELAALAEAHPELAPAAALERELLDGERRLQRRLGTPGLDRSDDDLRARLERGEALLAWDTLSIDWPEVRLRWRQVVDVLRRHDVLDAREASRLHDIGRDATLPDRVATWYAGDATDVPLGDVASLTVRPFLARAANVLQQRLPDIAWTRGTCPACGAPPVFGVLPTSGGQQLVCGRCLGRWSCAPETCPHCVTPGRLSTFSALDGVYQVKACQACRRYLKSIDVKRAGRPLMLAVDTVATLAVDQAVEAQGFTSS